MGSQQQIVPAEAKAYASLPGAVPEKKVEREKTKDVAVKKPGSYAPSGSEDEAVAAAMAQYRKDGGEKGAGYQTYTPDLQGYKDMLAAETDIAKKQKEYMDAKLALLFPNEEEKAQIKADIPQASTDALDYLLNNPPPTLAKPELSPRQMAAEMIGVSLVNIAASVSSGILGRGLTPDPGAMSAAENFPAQLNRIEKTEAERREIEMKQAAIDINYRNDVVGAKQAFDADQDESARAYLTQMNILTAQKAKDYMDAYGMLQDTKGRVLALTGNIANATNQAKMFNIGEANAAERERAAINRDLAKFAIDTRRQIRLEGKLAADRVLEITGGEQARIENNFAANIGGIPVAKTNALMANIGAKSSDVSWGQALAEAGMVYGPQSFDDGKTAYDKVKNVVPPELRNQVSTDLATIVETYHVVPGDALIAAIRDNPLTPMQNGEVSIAPAVREAIVLENPDLYNWQTPISQGGAIGQRFTADLPTGEKVNTPVGEMTALIWMRGYNSGAIQDYNTMSAINKQKKEIKAGN